MEPPRALFNQSLVSASSVPPSAAPHFLVTAQAPLVCTGTAVSHLDGTIATPPRAWPLLRQLLHRTGVVFAWEIKTFFLRPASYFLLLAAALVAGWSFSWLVTLLSHGTDPALRPADDLVSQFVGPNVFLIGGCTLLVPLLTMNAIADERRRASWELLLTAPVSSLAVVLGKFAALWSFFLTCIAPWLYYLIVLRGWNGTIRFKWGFVPWSDGPGLAFDLGPVCGGAIGLAVIGATFVALGLFCSGLCRRPASAALLSLFGMGTILAVGLAPRILEFWNIPRESIQFVEAISCWAHLERFSRGVIEPRLIAGHLTVCVLLLWATALVSRRVDQE